MTLADPAQLGAMIPIVAIVVGGAVAIFAPLARAHARQLDKQPRGITPEIGARFERMEQSIEAIAIEIERISEGQRFTTKLLAERAGAAGPPASAVGAPGLGALPAAERRS
jgi:phosphoribosylaminoimidazole carboxylase (NCAIR synthetase)